MMKKVKNVEWTCLMIYSVIIIYCMFFGLQRTQTIDFYRFQLIPNKWPLTFPKVLSIWMFDLGNIMAFIPFGILIPKVLKINFKGLIFLFVSSIFLLEILQSVTGLGAFDINDILANTLGLIIGYIVYKKTYLLGINIKSISISVIIVMISMISIMSLSEIGIQIFEKDPGQVYPITLFEEENKKVPQVEEFKPFIILGEEITPTLNLYSGGQEDQEYTYKFEKIKDVILYAYIGIEDGADFNGRVIIYVDEKVVYDNKNTGFGMESVELYFDEMSQIKIKISGDIKLWDIGLSNMSYNINK